MDSMSSDDEDDQDALSQQHSHRRAAGSSSKSPSLLGGTSSLLPLQKRKRVARACDECRRKKIKCDGKQPCTHCTVYSYDCTFNQPSNRRRNTAPAYIESVESRLHKVEAILRVVLPGINLEDPNFDAYSIKQVIDFSKLSRPEIRSRDREQKAAVDQSEDPQLQTVLDGIGSLELDDLGHWHYHGTSSAFAFMQNLRTHLSNSSLRGPYVPSSTSCAVSSLTESAKSAPSHYDVAVPSSTNLPDKNTAMRLCQNTLEVACALMRFIHKPTFYEKFDRIFNTDPDNYTNADTQFLPLLYVIMAIGCLFSQDEETTPQAHGSGSVTEKGFHFYQAAKNLLDITDCRDMIALQAVVFMIMFLQSTAKLATCYSYIGIALRSCCRLGLHRNITNNFNLIEREERKRIFWLVMKMDAYVGSILGLPQMLGEENIDQELPLDVDDEFIAPEGVSPMPAGYFPLIRASNAQTGLMPILQKVIKYIYPINTFKDPTTREANSISHSRIQEIESDLHSWMDNLPPELRASDDVPSELARLQHLVRLSYAHVQMMMYQPFLPSCRPGSASRTADKQSDVYAAACVNVARNIVHITTDMKSRCLLTGSHWFVMYTSYLSILSLVYFIFENPQSPSAKDILRAATAGRDVLDSLAKQSLAADRCSRSLMDLFTELPRRIHGQKSSLHEASSTRKRSNPADKAKMRSSFRQVSGEPTTNQKGTSPAGPAAGRVDAVSSKNASQRSARTFAMSDLADATYALDDSQQPWTGAWFPGLESGYATRQSARQASEGENQNTPRPPLYNQQPSDNVSGLGGLVYPSGDEFAFGNHPLSTLGNTQTAASVQQPSFTGLRKELDTASGNTPQSNFPERAFNSSTTIGTQQHHMPGLQNLGTNSQTRSYFPENLPVLRSSDGFAMSTGAMNRGPWQQHDTGRTGLTPGISLDVLLGADSDWSPAYADQELGRTQQP